MSDTVWRGNIDGGFQEQAIGNYPPVSDAADLDNIYLSMAMVFSLLEAPLIILILNQNQRMK